MYMGFQGDDVVHSIDEMQDPKCSSQLSGQQGSLYNLTLDEVQNQLGDLGKPLASMNLDEFLKTVQIVEGDHQATEGVDLSGLYSDRESSLRLSRDLKKRTVDDVLQDIQQDQRRGSSLDRKSTLGEITLEDFLVKAGVVAEGYAAAKKESGKGMAARFDQMGLPQGQWMNYPIHPQQQQQLGVLPVYIPGHVAQPHIGGNLSMDDPYHGSQMAVPSSPMMGTSSDTQTPRRKRVAPVEIAEKSVERRHKRMIKNRESAARSRARKQAYTHELENKVSLLEEENERLKRQQAWEEALPSLQLPETKYQLRRTSSWPL